MAAKVPILLELAGWGAISAGAFRVSITLGLVITGVGAIAYAALLDGARARRIRGPKQ